MDAYEVELKTYYSDQIVIEQPFGDHYEIKFNNSIWVKLKVFKSDKVHKSEILEWEFDNPKKDHPTESNHLLFWLDGRQIIHNDYWDQHDDELAERKLIQLTDEFLTQHFEMEIKPENEN